MTVALAAASYHASMDALVIGAGHAGLATSQCLRQRGVEHLVLERDQVGASWRNQRWDSFTLNTPTWMNRLPGDRDDDLGEPKDAFISHRSLVDRLETYVRRWDLPVREGVAVKQVERRPGARGYLVHFDGSLDGPIECDAVVVASGIQNVPKIPPIATALPDGISQLPALEYREAGRLRPGAVLVIGGGQTGGQVVEDLLSAGREVYWSVSRVTRLPRRYRGRDILAWLVDAGFYRAAVDEVIDPAERGATMPIISGVGRYGHTLSLQWLAAKGARLLGRVTDLEGSVLRLDDTVASSVRFGDERSAGVCRKIDEGILAAGMALPPLEPDEADVPSADPEALSSPSELDLEAANIRTVIFATGVRGDFSYLPPEAATSEGLPAHDHGSSPLPGIYYVGLPWLMQRSSGIIHGISPDAEAIADEIQAHLAARSTR